MRDLSAMRRENFRSLLRHILLQRQGTHVIQRLRKESTGHPKNVKMYVMININTSFII